MSFSSPLFAKYSSSSPAAASPANGVQSTDGFVAVFNLTVPFVRIHAQPTERLKTFFITDAKVTLENGKRGLFVVKGDISSGTIGTHICSILDLKEEIRFFDYSIPHDAAPFEFPRLRPKGENGMYPEGYYLIKEPSDWQIRDRLETVIEYCPPRNGLIPKEALPKPLDMCKGVEWREWLDLAGVEHDASPKKPILPTPEMALENHRAFMADLFATRGVSDEVPEAYRSAKEATNAVTAAAKKLVGIDSDAEEVTQSDAEREDAAMSEEEEEEDVNDDNEDDDEEEEEEEEVEVAVPVKAKKSPKASKAVASPPVKTTRVRVSAKAFKTKQLTAASLKRSARAVVVKEDPDFVFGTTGSGNIKGAIAIRKRIKKSGVVYDSDDDEVNV